MEKSREEVSEGERRKGEDGRDSAPLTFLESSSHLQIYALLLAFNW